MEKDVFIKLAKDKYGEGFCYDLLPEVITRTSSPIICKKPLKR